MNYKTLGAGLLKYAALKDTVELKDYQERAVKKIQDMGSLIVAHGTGTGKTVTSIAAAEKLKEQGKADKVLVIVPAALKSNFATQGVKKFTDSSVQIIETGKDRPSKKKDYLVVSNTLFSKNPEKYLKGRDTLILDEGHNARNTASNLYKSLEGALPFLRNKIVLTASPYNNSPGDLAPLLNIVSGKTTLTPGSLNKYIEPVMKRTGFLGLGGKVRVNEKFNPSPELAEILRRYVDYEPGDEQLPDVERDVVKVPMTKQQMRAYRYTWEGLPPEVKRAIQKDILPEKQDIFEFFSRIANARLASNNPKALLNVPTDKPYELSGKALYIKDNLKPSKNGLGDIIYSNYCKNAAELIAQLLEDEEIEHSLLTGNLSSKQKDREVKEFIEGKSKVLITTPTGKEGFSIPNARSVIIHDPHWNPEVTRQAMGRGVRINSLADKVIVKELIAVEPDEPPILGFIKRKKTPSVEEWMKSVSDKKKNLQKQVYEYFGR